MKFNKGVPKYVLIEDFTVPFLSDAIFEKVKFTLPE